MPPQETSPVWNSGEELGKPFSAGARAVGISFPKSSLTKVKPWNSSWLMALTTTGSIGVSCGSSDVKSLSKLVASVGAFYTSHDKNTENYFKNT